MDWFAVNWGNIASMIGLVLSIPSLWISLVAWRESSTAKALVDKSQRRQRLFHLSFGLQRSLHQIEGLLDSKAKTWPQRKCDRLRESLSELIDEAILDEEDKTQVRIWVSDLCKPVARTDRSCTRIRQLSSRLISIRSRVSLQLQGME